MIKQLYLVSKHFIYMYIKYIDYKLNSKKYFIYKFN